MTPRQKARLTITLSPRVLDDLDRTIDGQTIRNRSHAIEVLLQRCLKAHVGTAVVLAGGKAGRNAPALQPIAGRPLIARTLAHLMDHGVHDFLVLAGRHESAVRDLLGDGASLGASIRYLSEREPVGTAGALRLARPHLADGTFMVIHGDVLTDIDLSAFIDFHRTEGAPATMAVKPRQAEPDYGRVMLQGNRITEFIESSGEGGISIINTGVYLFEPSVFDVIGSDGAVMLEHDVFPELARAGELSAFFFQGIWYDTSRGGRKKEDHRDETEAITWTERVGGRSRETSS